jgi:hypothetical protein
MMYNIKLFDFSEIFTTSLQKKILDNLYINKQIINNQINLRNKETKQLIENVLLDCIQTTLTISENNKLIIVVQPTILPKLEIHEYCDYGKFQNLLLKLLKTVRQIYPKNIFIFTKPVDITSIDTLALIFHKANSF